MSESLELKNYELLLKKHDNDKNLALKDAIQCINILPKDNWARDIYIKTANKLQKELNLKPSPF